MSGVYRLKTLLDVIQDGANEGGMLSFSRNGYLAYA